MFDQDTMTIPRLKFAVIIALAALLVALIGTHPEPERTIIPHAPLTVHEAPPTTTAPTLPVGTAETPDQGVWLAGPAEDSTATLDALAQCHAASYRVCDYHNGVVVGTM